VAALHTLIDDCIEQLAIRRATRQRTTRWSESFREETEAMKELYLEDFEAGQTYRGPGRIRIDKEGIKRFAAEFDPQPFHLDEKAAASSIFGDSSRAAGTRLR